MSRIVSRAISLGLLLAACEASAQPPAERDPRQMAVSIPLRDAEGIVRANLFYRWNPNGPSAVFLTDARSRTPVATIPAGPPAPGAAPGPGTGGNPFAGLPPLRPEGYRNPPAGFGRTPGQSPEQEGRSDGQSDSAYLLGRIRYLEDRLAQVEQRLNAASRR
jgi:hypothetical protein